MKTRKVTLRRLFGLPVKRQTRIVRKKSTYRKPHIAKIKKPTKFQQGWQAANALTNTWNAQPNPPRVYVLDRRIHHGEVGVLAGLAGILYKDSFWTGFGTRLALDDIHDANEWFTFKKREQCMSFNHNFA